MAHLIAVVALDLGPVFGCGAWEVVSIKSEYGTYILQSREV